jgi:hypothetical protein
MISYDIGVWYHMSYHSICGLISYLNIICYIIYTYGMILNMISYMISNMISYTISHMISCMISFMISYTISFIMVWYHHYWCHPKRSVISCEIGKIPQKRSVSLDSKKQNVFSCFRDSSLLYTLSASVRWCRLPLDHWPTVWYKKECMRLYTTSNNSIKGR